ncbi:carboxypeptidase N subunit 2-like [Paramacrobiotus metropolitanus]|uniref:carboxypeptidase N subunit 2-like n=1 Tax=Paramacrobiotus metropolitanus TaxID=2943436 RepID=UPI002445D0BC|nr:carboxypeptidase N subunit 2-like [Paramacrobiotus metropolitanus]
MWEIFVYSIIATCIAFVRGGCPPAGYSLCNCTEVRTSELVVSCDGLNYPQDIKYQLEGIPIEEITELAILRSKDLRGMRPDFFKGYKKLERLSLAANPNSNLVMPVGLFDTIGSTLEALDLSTSNQTEQILPPELLAPLGKLKHLDLSNNQIAQLRPSMFENLKSLQVLDLSDNQVAGLPAYVIADLLDLKMLDLSNNRLQELPLDLFDDTQDNLKIMDIGGNRISSLTSTHFTMMPNLTVLDTRKNPINALSNDLFSGTPNLARICFDGIQAAVIPPHIFDSIPLESLDLSDLRNVRALPESLLSRAGKTLKELHLDDNPKLLEIPGKFFRGLSALEILDISNTGIELLPNSFWTDLPELRKLKLSSNPWLLSVPPPKSISPQLKYVDAANCPKFPVSVKNWVKANFDTTPLLLDFPINIYRSVNKEIQLRHITAAPPATTAPPFGNNNPNSKPHHHKPRPSSNDNNGGSQWSGNGQSNGKPNGNQWSNNNNGGANDWQSNSNSNTDNNNNNNGNNGGGGWFNFFGR